MRRRNFITGLAGMVAFPLAARAQTPNRTYRLGHLANSADCEAFTARSRCRNLHGLASSKAAISCSMRVSASRMRCRA